MSDDIDFSELKPTKRKPTKREAARYRKWVRYLSASKLTTEEIHRRAEGFTKQGLDPNE